MTNPVNEQPKKKNTKVALVDDTGESYGRGGIADPVDKKGPKKWVRKPTKTKTT